MGLSGQVVCDASRLVRVAMDDQGGFQRPATVGLGLDPGTVDYEVRQWFWRPDCNWRD